MFQLHDYQQKLVNKSRQLLAGGASGVLIVSPAGSGKSVIIAEIARLATNKKNHVLFIVHRKELAEQIEQTFLQNNVDLDYVTIETVGRAKNRLDEMAAPDLIITDESHHSRAKTYKTIYDYYPQALKLGFTASPWRMNGKGFADIYDEMVEGPDVSWLIENEFLAPYRYFAPTIADIKALRRNSTGDYSQRSMDNAFKNAIWGDVVEHYQKLADGQQAILYAHSIAASEAIADEFNGQGIVARHVDGSTPKKQREAIMEQFKAGDIKVLTNVDIVSEGFNVPDCTCVILLRPTQSLVLHIQQSMRSMRYKPDKQATIIDHVANYTLHGLPDTEREWMLKDWKTPSAKSEKNKSPTRVCEACYAVVPSKELKCPICGYEIELEKKKPIKKEVVDVELKEIKAFTFTTQYKKRKNELETLEDYYIYAKENGYKESWIKFQMPELKSISWPQFYQKLNTLKETI